MTKRARLAAEGGGGGTTTRTAPVFRVRIGAPEDVLAQARRRGVMLPAEYYGSAQARARMFGFSVAGIDSIAQLQAVKDSLDKALGEGIGFDDWRRSVLRGEVPLALPQHRLETIFRTNMATLYSRGKGAQVLRHVDTHPYLLYSAVNDSRTRPTHAAMNGTILPVTDPWWSTHRPPNGYNCRCTAIALTEAQARKRGITPVAPSGPGAQPDPGWGYDPWDEPGKGLIAAAERLAAKSLPPRLRAALAETVRTAQEMVPPSPITPNEAIGYGRQAFERIATAIAQSTGRAFDATNPADLMAFRMRLLDQIVEAHGPPVAARVARAGGQARGRQAANLVSRAGELLPASWVSATNAFGPLRITQIPLGPRPFQYTNSTATTVRSRMANHRGVQEIQPRHGIIATNAVELDSALHEFAHRVQHALPSLDELFQAYYAQRTANEPLQRLAHLLPTHGYRQHELARPDRFFHPYVGRWYPPFQSASQPFGALEMMTVSLDHLLAGNAARMRDLMAADPEFAQFVIGVLLRWRP